MNTKFLTTAEAARRARVSRPTISRALKSGDIDAIRDNSGMWKITPEAVDAWVKSRSSVQNEQRSYSVQNAPDERAERIAAELSDTRAALARAEGENAANRERIADLCAERDRLLTMLDARPSAPDAVQPGRPWWRFWE